MSYVSHLECSACRKQYPAGQPQNLCECGRPLLVRYRLDRIRAEFHREQLAAAPRTMWRYAPLLPVSDPRNMVSLGEGGTPLIRAERLGKSMGAGNLWVKDEGLNPTGSFKARGISCAVSMCRELGLRRLAIPSAGNAAGALAAYAAAAGLESHIFMPGDVPQANLVECRAFGARVTLVDGLISDCSRMVAERCEAEGWFDVSTLKEPYRIEGKKTMGLEVAEYFEWDLPDAILYPAGGGVGLIGMWKAFEEMERLGWIGTKRPRMIAVQAAGCAPVVRAFEKGEPKSEFWRDAHTVAAGLRVPKALGDFLMLEAISASGGTAVAVSDTEMLDAGADLASSEGIFAAPEGAACAAAARRLFADGFLKPSDRAVLFNTGSGYKYLEVWSTRFPRNVASEQDKLGGLITPR
jgi:threonine synthase